MTPAPRTETMETMRAFSVMVCIAFGCRGEDVEVSDGAVATDSGALDSLVSEYECLYADIITRRNEPSARTGFRCCSK